MPICDSKSGTLLFIDNKLKKILDNLLWFFLFFGASYGNQKMQMNGN